LYISQINKGKKMHHLEWIKRYSPRNKILKIGELASMLNMPPNNVRYYLKLGYELLDKKEPELVLKSGNKIKRLKRAVKCVK
tara:strand:+ start:1219 stop:1464 length:246 start_codon:yes stop_codon:yes gene_type:complete